MISFSLYDLDLWLVLGVGRSIIFFANYFFNMKMFSFSIAKNKRQFFHDRRVLLIANPRPTATEKAGFGAHNF